MKTVSNHIFKILKEKGMSQKELSERTGIPESTISDWKKKNNNPTADKLMIISEVLGVDIYELLSGSQVRGKRTREPSIIVIEKETELGQMVTKYQELPDSLQKRLLGYLEALSELKEKNT